MQSGWHDGDAAPAQIDMGWRASVGFRCRARSWPLWSRGPCRLARQRGPRPYWCAVWQSTRARPPSRPAIVAPSPCWLLVQPELMADQFQPAAAASGLVVIPAPGFFSCDLDCDAALGPEAQLLRGGQLAFWGAEKREGEISDPIVQQFRRPSQGHAGDSACLRADGASLKPSAWSCPVIGEAP